MKLTSKLAILGFDYKYFYETLDYQGHGQLKFVHFLALIKEKFSIYLSEDEIEALFLYLSPKHAQLRETYHSDKTISI